MPTLKDIAQVAKVHISTVSVVLNDKPTRIKISDSTRSRILEAADQLNYQPNASAKALVTGKSGNLGFILSDHITDGWGNSFFAAQLMGAEDRCREIGYGLSISRYNLNNLEEFVFPKKVQQRNVDGLVLAGDASVEVVEKFAEFGIPCVGIGITPEVSDMIPTVSVDIVSLYARAVDHLYNLGHRKIGIVTSPDKRSKSVGLKAQKRITEGKSALPNCDIKIIELSRQTDWQGGEEAFDQWFALPPSQRPGAVLACDQASLGFLHAMKKRGFKCPQDISIISNVDTVHCRYSDPPLTAMSYDQFSFGQLAVDLLINKLEDNALEPEQSILEPKFTLVERESCGRFNQRN